MKLTKQNIMNRNIMTKYFFWIAENAEMIAISSLFVMFLLILVSRKGKLKSPIGEGFKNIRLPNISCRSAYSAFDFKYLVRGVLVIGGAGSGKTKSIIQPLLMQTIKKGYSGIIYDFKFPALASFVYEESLLASPENPKIFYVNFTDPSRSNRFNVFKRVDNSSYAKEYASTLIMNLMPESIQRQDFFLRSTSSLLAATIFYFSRKQARFCTLPHVLSFLLHHDTKRVVDLICEDPEASDLVAPVRSGLSSGDQTAGVIATLQNALSAISNPITYWVLSGDDFDLNLNDPNTPSLMVIGNDASLIDSISPIISLVITVATKSMNTRGKERSILLLDEGPTLFLPNFDTIPATGRENKIATVYCGQDIAQMEERYGHKKSEVLVSNLATQFYGKVSNPNTAEKVVRIFGRDEVEFESRSTSIGESNRNSSAYSSSLQQRDRLSITQLRDLNPGEFVATTLSHKNLKVRFKQGPSPTFDLPELFHVPADAVNINFNRIKAEVAAILNSSTEDSK